MKINIEEYIKNGIVEDYCLNLIKEPEKSDFEKALRLYPELRREFEEVQESLYRYATLNAMAPPKYSKEKIWNTLQNLNLEENMELSNLPIINQYSDYKKWLEVVKPLLPKEVPKGHFMKNLTQTETVMQLLVMTSTDVEDEVHEDVYESFIILEGECECRIGDHTIVRLKAGGFMNIPLNEHHDLKIISDHVVGIMQRISVAA